MKAATFRDPEGTCWGENGKIFRYVYPQASERLRAFHASALSRDLQAKKLLPATRELAPDEVAALAFRPRPGSEGGLYLEHEKIPFVSYAHEWSPAMLFAAGLATLDIQREALAAGYTLKDATPANILFDGGRCVMVDYLSFEPVRTDDYLWIAEGQFIRTFVLPLLLYRLTGEAPNLASWGRRDGLDPVEVYRKLSWMDRLRPKALRFVTAPAWLAGKAAGAKKRAQSRPPSDPKRNAFMRGALLSSLRKAFLALNPVQTSRSRWSEYMSEHNYDAVEFKAKESFVASALAEMKPRRLLDVGCNTGHFSRMAAVTGADVVAVDYDALSVDHVFNGNRTEHPSIQPLVVNLAWPSPALGWNYGEHTSFLGRAESHFDSALMLAVIHHLAVTDGIPFGQIFALMGKLVTAFAVVEYVGVEDSMMQALLFNKEHLVPVLSQKHFEEAMAPWFTIVRRQPISNGRRCLYLIQRTAISST